MIYFRDFIPPSHIERLVPTSSLFLVIELDGMTRQVLDNNTLSVLQEIKGGWISGLQKHYRNISAHSGSEMLIVQFRPLWASSFLPVPLTDYEDRIVPEELAFRWGYSDQSHLIREFHFFSGFIPTDFLGREFHKDGTNFIPLVKKRQDRKPVPH